MFVCNKLQHSRFTLFHPLRGGVKWCNGLQLIARKRIVAVAVRPVLRTSVSYSA